MAAQKDFAVPVLLVEEVTARAKAAGKDYIHFNVDDAGRLWLNSPDSITQESWDTFPPPPPPDPPGGG